jgi:hypothetical protein
MWDKNVTLTRDENLTISDENLTHTHNAMHVWHICDSRVT